MRQNILDKLENYNACSEGRRWLSGKKSLKDAYDNCDQGSYLAWMTWLCLYYRNYDHGDAYYGAINNPEVAHIRNQIFDDEQKMALANTDKLRARAAKRVAKNEAKLAKEIKKNVTYQQIIKGWERL